MMNAHINEICIDIIVSPLQHNSSGVICHKINRYERSANHENISESKHKHKLCVLTWRNVPIAVFGDVLRQSGTRHGHPRTLPVQLL